MAAVSNRESRQKNALQVVPEIAGGHTEEKLSEACFDLVFAFDEVITTGGYREAIDLRQIRANLEMARRNPACAFGGRAF